MAQMMYPHADCKFGNQVGLAGISPPAQLTTITMQTIVAKPIPSTTLAPNIFGNPRPRRWRHDRAERAERSSSTSARTRTRMVMAAMAAQRFRISSVGAQIANSKNRNATMIWAQTKYRRRTVGTAGRVFESTAICLSLYFHIFGAAIPEGPGSAVESRASRPAVPFGCPLGFARGFGGRLARRPSLHASGPLLKPERPDGVHAGVGDRRGRHSPLFAPCPAVENPGDASQQDIAPVKVRRSFVEM